MRGKISYLVDGAVLLSLCGLFFWRDLTPVAADRWTFVPGDFAQQFYTFARYEASRLLQGQLPLWNPYNYAGHPFLADIQSAVFYPLRLLTIFLTAAHDFSYRALELEALAHYPLAAFFTYLLARRLTRSRFGGFMAAAVFTFSGYFTSYPPLQLAILETQTWLPLILLCWELAADRLAQGRARAAWRWAVVAGLVFGVALLAGHPQAGLLTGYASVAYGAYRLWLHTRGAKGRVQAAGMLMAFGLIGVGVAAVQLLPSWEFTTLSTRSRLGFEEAGTGFMPYELIQLVFPAIGGEFPALYVGLLPLGLAALALTSIRRDPETPQDARRTIGFLGWALLVAVLLSFGKHLALYSIPYLLAPGWSLFRGQERTIVWAVLALALLAGYSASWLAQRWALPHPQKAGKGAVDERHSHRGGAEDRLTAGFRGATLGALALALVFFVGYQAGRDSMWGFTTASLTVALFLFLTVVALGSRQPALLLAVLLIDLFTITPPLHASPLKDRDLSPFQSLVAIPLADTDISRVANDDALPGNYGLLYGLEDWKGSSPLWLANYDWVMKPLPVEQVWRLLNVKYVFSWQQELAVPADRLAEEIDRKTQKPVYVYRLADSGARAWLTGEVIAEPDRERALQRMAAADYNVARQVVLPAVPAGFGTASDCGGTIVWRERAPERLTLDVTTAQPCILVLSELVYPGWQVTVDGKPASGLQADLILRAVALGVGQHTVVWVFHPASVRWGAVVTVLTIVCAGAWLVFGLGRSKTARHD